MTKLTDGQIDTKLLQACVYRNLEMAKEALEQGADVNCRRSDFMAPLHVAAEHGDTKMIRLLCKQPEIQIEIRTMHGLTPLHTATLLGHTRAVKLLLMLGAAPNSLDNLERCSLHYAALQRDVETARVLIRQRADVNVHDAFHESPLYTSVMRRPCVPMIKLLLDNRASVLSTTEEGTLGLLLEAVLATKDESTMDLVKLLFAYGANVNTTDPIAQRTPLHIVAMNGNVELAEYLIEHGAALFAKNRAGKTPMDVAINFRQYEIAKLIEESAFQSIQSHRNNTITSG